MISCSGAWHRGWFLFLFVPCLLFAQKERKGSYFRADSYLLEEKYEKAVSEIERVVASPKKAKRSDVWHLRGKIYQAVLTHPDPAVRALAPNAYLLAKESFSAVVTRQGKKTALYTDSMNRIQNVYSYLLGKGIDAYTAADYEGAYGHFTRALEIKPHSETALSNAALVAQQLGKREEVAAMYYRLLDLDKADEAVYEWLIDYEGGSQKDEEKQWNLLMAAREQFPNHAGFLKREIDRLIGRNEIDAAEEKLKKAVAQEPDNVLLYLNLAIIHDNRALQAAADSAAAEAFLETAKGYYEAILSRDAEHFIANYNLGVVYGNLAKKHYDAVRKMDIKTYNRAGAATNAKGDAIMVKGLPYLQRAHEIDPTDSDVMTTLYQVYSQMDRKADAALMREKMK